LDYLIRCGGVLGTHPIINVEDVGNVD